MDCISKTLKIEDYLKTNLSYDRLKHVDGVVSEVKKLADIHNGDKSKCIIAAQFHDMAREKSNTEIDQLIRKYQLETRYLSNVNLAHGKVAAEMMRDIWGITDKETLDAVAYHTTARADMSKTEKILFIADAIEPSRNYNGVKKLRDIAYKDLDRACLEAIDSTILYLREKGIKKMEKDTLEAKVCLENRLKDKRG